MAGGLGVWEYLAVMHTDVTDRRMTFVVTSVAVYKASYIKGMPSGVSGENTVNCHLLLVSWLVIRRIVLGGVRK